MHVQGLMSLAGTCVNMGKSSSKLEAKEESDTATTRGVTECENGTKHSTLNHQQSDTSQIKVQVRRSKPSLSTQGKRSSFYETVDANEVLPYLIIGNMASAKDSSFLERKNVGFILSLTSDPTEDETVEGVEYKAVPMEDDEEEQLEPHLDGCFQFIDKANPDKGSPKNKTQKKQEIKSRAVLVHSYFGMSRSAAVVLAYLMKEKDQTLRQAYDHLKQCHSATNPNDNFIVQLLRIEQELHDGKMTMTLKDFYH